MGKTTTFILNLRTGKLVPGSLNHEIATPDKSGLAMTRRREREFPRHHTDQAYYKSDSMSTEYFLRQIIMRA
jgi:hypothetical protein